MERKIGCNLLYNLKERKSGPKPERVRKSRRLHCIIKKCTKTSIGFAEISGLNVAESFTVRTLRGSVTLRKQNEGGELKEGTEEIRVWVG